MKYFSTFSGVGGFELGIEYADLSRHKIQKEGAKRQRLEGQRNSIHPSFSDESSCVGVSEIDKYASAVLKYRFPETKNYGDITKIDWSTVPDFDLLVGGSPCQDLSVAGKQRGLEGERSGLFYEFMRGVREKEPAYFIWENVKGALSSNQGWDFAQVQIEMEQAGYSLWWQVLNAKDFGVPQNRERIFVVGTRNRSPREVFFEPGGSGNNLKEITQGVSDAQRIYGTEGLAKSQKALGGGLGAKTGLYAIPTLTPDRINKRQNGRRFKEDGEPAFSLTAQDRHGIYDGTRIRRLTPIECERLMSWPDNWTQYGDFDGEIKEISDSQRYKMCGNGVVSEVVKWVFNQVIL